MRISESWGVTRLAPTAAELLTWEGISAMPVSPGSQRHTIHSYFNCTPESPDGSRVLFFASSAPAGEQGDLTVRDRRTGDETTVAENIVTEDAHRVACQQWVDGGKALVYHEYRDGRWFVVTVNPVTRQRRVLAEDRQLGFGSPLSEWVPVYGCHWNPGQYRDLQLANVCTGEIRTVASIADVLAQCGDWARKTLGDGVISVFFPVMSAQGDRVFFKLARGRGGNDFRSPDASAREGKVVFDLKQNRLLRIFSTWGHPSWHPDGKRIFEKGNGLQDSETAAEEKLALTPTNHPTISPDGRYFTSDADVSGRDFGKPNEWAVLVARTTGEGFVVLHQFDNSGGASSWRRNHPHPVFSADGQRVYFNVSDGRWTRLFFAEAKAT